MQQACLALLMTATVVNIAGVGAATNTTSKPTLCICDETETTATGQNEIENVVRIAAIFDTHNLNWSTDIINFTVSMLNDHTDGWHDDVLNDGTVIDVSIGRSDCDEKTATESYWDLRQGIHGVFGARCSGASISVARIAGLENVTQISPSSTSSQLSDMLEFPRFFRTVAPDDANGEVGATLAMLRYFGWDRVSILRTDTVFALDLSKEFQKLWSKEHRDKDTGRVWKGEVGYTNTITFTGTGDVDEESVREVLSGVPTGDPRISSRVIMLAAHTEDAFRILDLAAQMKFQPDTIWVGWSWIGRHPNSSEWVPPVPGYLGLMPFQNKNDHYVDFLRRLQSHQLSEGREPWDDFDHYSVAYAVDAIVALAMALSAVSAHKRRDGDSVSNALRRIEFEGVSGPVSFTPVGDRRNPKYSVMNFQRVAGGGYDWVSVGSVGTKMNSADIQVQDLCFAAVGCGEGIPSDKYPISNENKNEKKWIAAVSVISCALLILACNYWRSRQQKRALKHRFSEMLAKIEAVKKIDSKLMEIENKRNRLMRQRTALQAMPDTWTTSDKTLVDVEPCDEQYWDVLAKLRNDMTDAHISKLWRIQNTSLWSHYSFQISRLAMSDIDINERSVWHGTSSVEPSVIYNDLQDGFTMQFSKDGFWGRGIYFSEKSSYSFCYSYDGKKYANDPSFGATDEREMFLARLLVGNEIYMDREESRERASECMALTVPPINPDTNLRYNTVTGWVGDSQVWVTYENGRAYPEYLVRYYRGPWDPLRTPFQSKREAMNSLTASTRTIRPDDGEEGMTQTQVSI